ncbi:MAG: Uma2 family endonuclease [Blastocatellia bacterium]
MPEIAKRLFTVEEYHQIIETGILEEDDRIELINGEILKMPPIGSHHAAYVDKLNALFSPRLVGQALVRIQSPIRLNNLSQPQPDLALLRPRDDFYWQAHPTVDDVMLVVEVAETSSEYDRTVKLPLYAQSSIDEVWLIDVSNRRLEVYRQPQEGQYRQVHILLRGHSISPLHFPSFNISIDSLLF